MNTAGACIVQRDFTVLVEREHPAYETAREYLQLFAELMKSPAHYHTYRITPLSLWNAAAKGMTAEEIIDSLRAISRWDLPSGVVADIQMWVNRYGSLKLYTLADDPSVMYLESFVEDSNIFAELERIENLFEGFSREVINESKWCFPTRYRGRLKQELARLGYPVMDEAGYHSGRDLHFGLRSELPSGRTFALRSYQYDGVEAFAGEREHDGGNGVLVLPCGAGKTVIGLGVMNKFQCETLILTSNVTSVRQWISEIVDKTSLTALDVGEYSGEKKEVRPVTVSTYQILTHRAKKGEDFKHMRLFNERDWGLIIYDEVHLLPAPVFRATADIQATRRLGLTATLVREDGCERDVFSLIGPKRYEVPWRSLEESGYIAQVECQEVRVPMSTEVQVLYNEAQGRDKFRIAAENPMKMQVLQRLVQLHSGRQILIIGQYLDQLHLVASALNAPLITGNLPQAERTRLYQAFRNREIALLVVSKVANFAVDLPDASVAIQISGSFGSRQEEAQRLGRILRPKGDGSGAFFYTLVSEGTREQDFAMRRQMFLIEQGYDYAVKMEREEGA